MSLSVKDGDGVSRALPTYADPAGNLIPVHSTDGTKATYRAAVSGVAPGATPQDFLVLTGSATKTVRVKRILLGGVATAAGNMPFTLVRRSTGPSGGTPVTPTIAKHDPSDAAPTAVVTHYTAANTPGASAGNLEAGRHPMMTVATGASLPLVLDFSTRSDKAIVLRGVSDYLAVNYAGGALTAGAAWDYSIEWEEDAS